MNHLMNFIYLRILNTLFVKSLRLCAIFWIKQVRNRCIKKKIDFWFYLIKELMKDDWIHDDSFVYKRNTYVQSLGSPVVTFLRMGSHWPACSNEPPNWKLNWTERFRTKLLIIVQNRNDDVFYHSSLTESLNSVQLVNWTNCSLVWLIIYTGFQYPPKERYWELRSRHRRQPLHLGVCNCFGFPF